MPWPPLHRKTDRRDSDERPSSFCVEEAYEVDGSTHEGEMTAGSSPSWSLQSILPLQKPERPGTGSHRSPLAVRKGRACDHQARRSTGHAWSLAALTSSVFGVAVGV